MLGLRGARPLPGMEGGFIVPSLFFILYFEQYIVLGLQSNFLMKICNYFVAVFQALAHVRHVTSITGLYFQAQFIF